MMSPSWKVSGQYYETCGCDFVCPCILQQMTAAPSKGACAFAMAFQVEHGTFGTVPLDGLGFIVLGRTPEAMAKGNWSVGVVVDDRATTGQCDAITAIVSGTAGGPMAAVSGLVGTFSWRRFRADSLRPQRRQVDGQGLPPGRYGSRGRHGPESRRTGTAPRRQYRASRQQSACALPRLGESRQRARIEVGRSRRTEQRALRPVRLAERLDSKPQCAPDDNGVVVGGCARCGAGRIA